MKALNKGVKPKTKQMKLGERLLDQQLIGWKDKGWRKTKFTWGISTNLNALSLFNCTANL